MRRRFDIGDFVNVTTKQSVKDDLVNRFKKRRAEFGISQKELSRDLGLAMDLSEGLNPLVTFLLSLLKISDVIDCLEDFNELFKILL